MFYVKPAADQVETPDGRPEPPLMYLTYDWLNQVKRENHSDIVFPTLESGDVLIHNFTVWHAVAPIERGTRYSFVLFYDMDNPAIQHDFQHDSDDDERLSVVFFNGMQQHVDLAFVYDMRGGERVVDVIEKNMAPSEERGLYSYEGHVFRAFLHGTETLVCEFVIREEQNLYTIERTGAAEDRPGEEL